MTNLSDKRDAEFREKILEIWDEYYKSAPQNEKIDGIFYLATKIIAALYVDFREIDKEIFFPLLKQEILLTADKMKDAPA